jgi:hypothetical protein
MLYSARVFKRRRASYHRVINTFEDGEEKAINIRYRDGSPHEILMPVAAPLPGLEATRDCLLMGSVD